MYVGDLTSTLHAHCCIDDVPPEAINSRELPRNVSTSEGFGFTITWNRPNVDQSFITGYKVYIVRVVSDSGRSSRQGGGAISVDRGTTEYTFTDGDPFTDYMVNVDADLNVNGAEGRVAALTETTLRTAEGSELWTCPPLLHVW